MPQAGKDPLDYLGSDCEHEFEIIACSGAEDIYRCIWCGETKTEKCNYIPVRDAYIKFLEREKNE
jgi:hypothetical protein